MSFNLIATLNVVTSNYIFKAKCHTFTSSTIDLSDVKFTQWTRFKTLF